MPLDQEEAPQALVLVQKKVHLIIIISKEEKDQQALVQKIHLIVILKEKEYLQHLVAHLPFLEALVPQEAHLIRALEQAEVLQAQALIQEEDHQALGLALAAAHPLFLEAPVL